MLFTIKNNKRNYNKLKFFCYFYLNFFCINIKKNKIEGIVCLKSFIGYSLYIKKNILRFIPGIKIVFKKMDIQDVNNLKYSKLFISRVNYIKYKKIIFLSNKSLILLNVVGDGFNGEFFRYEPTAQEIFAYMFLWLIRISKLKIKKNKIYTINNEFVDNLDDFYDKLDFNELAKVLETNYPLLLYNFHDFIKSKIEIF